MTQFLLMAALNGRVGGADLQQWIEKANSKRRKLIVRLAEVLFSIIAFFYGKLDPQVKTASGTTLAATDSAVSTEDKLRAMLQAVADGHNNTLLNSMLKPLFMWAAEFLADMLEVPPELLALISSQGMSNPGSGSSPIINISPPAPPSSSPSSLATAPGSTVTAPNRLVIPRGITSALRRANGVANGTLFVTEDGREYYIE